jgi:hypothetical protein
MADSGTTNFKVLKLFACAVMGDKNSTSLEPLLPNQMYKMIPHGA